MVYAALKLVHVLGVVLWVGGMAFVQLFLRPSLAQLAPPQRLALMQEVLRRFFTAVSWVIAAVLASGLWMLGDVETRVADTGGQLSWPWGWSVMSALGLVMAVVFVYIRLVPYRRLRRTLGAGDLPGAAAALAQVRQWVLVNLVFGGVVIVAALLGGA